MEPCTACLHVMNWWSMLAVTLFSNCNHHAWAAGVQPTIRYGQSLWVWSATVNSVCGSYLSIELGVVVSYCIRYYHHTMWKPQNSNTITV
jgi:hypothetical protein